ncbi:hypothetical protein LT708_25210 [Pseudomonas syringae pv. syringae]|uniref:hypothetical protein n=1 Tax=Pseudomonas syringae TaxID=317 RepID=UPI002009DD6D|nr:hypothetical protein [Pseudomonas syringae]MCK9759894.1 hypothetical protein [Pseudomonas syringae pv. syringae]MCK9774885.1 hypothetical protein [Pseudomonas syringae pv. syringae]
MLEKAFYVPGQPWVIDFAKVRQDGVFVSELHGLTLDEIKAHNPNAIITDYELAEALIHGDVSGQPRQILEEDYLYVRSELPVFDQFLGLNTESFKIDSDGDGYTIYARLELQCFKFKSMVDLSHQEVMRRIKISIQASRMTH